MVMRIVFALALTVLTTGCSNEPGKNSTEKKPPTEQTADPVALLEKIVNANQARIAKAAPVNYYFNKYRKGCG